MSTVTVTDEMERRAALLLGKLAEVSVDFAESVRYQHDHGTPPTIGQNEAPSD